MLNTLKINPLFIFNAFKKLEDIGLIIEGRESEAHQIMQECLQAHIRNMESLQKELFPEYDGFYQTEDKKYMTDYEKIFNEELSKGDNKELNIILSDAQKRETEIWRNSQKNIRNLNCVHENNENGSNATLNAK